jgi:hypothetical protein
MRKALIYAGVLTAALGIWALAASIVDPVLKLGRLEIDNLGALAFTVGVDPAIDGSLRLRDNTGADQVKLDTLDNMTINALSVLLPIHAKSYFDTAVAFSTGTIGGLCSNCTNTYSICVATGTLAAQWRVSGAANGCGTGN